MVILDFLMKRLQKKMIYNAGYEISMFDLTVGDVNKFSNIFHSIGLIRPNLFAFQFLIVAKKK